MQRGPVTKNPFKRQSMRKVVEPNGHCLVGRSSIDNVASCGYITEMKTVGIRELKNRLSEYLRTVRSGESVLITDRGEIVAEFSPPGHGQVDPSVPAGLRALARRGVASLGSPGRTGLYKVLPRKHRGKRSSAQLQNEERGTR